MEFFINKGVLGLCKEASHKVWQYRGDTVRAHATEKFDDLQQYLQLPVVPPSMVDVCSLVQIYYTLKVSIPLWHVAKVRHHSLVKVYVQHSRTPFNDIQKIYIYCKIRHNALINLRLTNHCIRNAPISYDFSKRTTDWRDSYCKVISGFPYYSPNTTCRYSR